MAKPFQTRRTGFTLIELLIASTILALISLYLFQTMDFMQTANKSLQRDHKQRDFSFQIKRVIIDDILKAKQMKILNGKDFDLLQLVSSNSLHGLMMPHISYVVNKQHQLFRLEAIKPIKLPINQDEVYHYKYDLVMDNLQYFKIYDNNLSQAKKDSNKTVSQKALIAIKTKVNQNPLIFEIFLPFARL